MPEDTRNPQAHDVDEITKHALKAKPIGITYRSLITTLAKPESGTAAREQYDKLLEAEGLQDKEVFLNFARVIQASSTTEMTIIPLLQREVEGVELEVGMRYTYAANAPFTLGRDIYFLHWVKKKNG